MRSRYSKKRPADDNVSTLTMEELTQKLEELIEPHKPHRKRILTNDGTMESLHEINSHNIRGILLWRDELIGLLRHLDKPERGGDKEMYLTAHGGTQSYTLDRIVRGNVECERLCYGVFGGMTPSKLIPYLASAISGEDNGGLIQRFQLPVYPDPVSTWDDRKPNQDAIDEVQAVINRLVALPIRDEDNGIPTVRFADEAQPSFDEWYADLRNDKLNRPDHPVMIEHLSKYSKLMPALALIFHLVHTEVSPVCQDCALRAAAWCDYLEAHARRIYGLVLSPTAGAAKLAQKIQEGHLPSGFTVNDVKQKDWAMLDTSEKVEAACVLLVRKDWLRRQETSPSSSGGRPTVKFLINPKVKATGSHEQVA